MKRLNQNFWSHSRYVGQAYTRRINDFVLAISLKLLFLQVCGRVADVNIVRKSFSDFYGFVTFTSPDAAEDALEGKVCCRKRLHCSYWAYNNHTIPILQYDFYIRGRRLRVRRAYLKSPRSPISFQGECCIEGNMFITKHETIDIDHYLRDARSS